MHKQEAHAARAGGDMCGEGRGWAGAAAKHCAVSDENRSGCASASRVFYNTQAHAISHRVHTASRATIDAYLTVSKPPIGAPTTVRPSKAVRALTRWLCALKVSISHGHAPKRRKEPRAAFLLRFLTRVSHKTEPPCDSSIFSTFQGSRVPFSWHPGMRVLVRPPDPRLPTVG
eukprot:6208583-Prymnesium_polylepis.1